MNQPEYRSSFPSVQSQNIEESQGQRQSLSKRYKYCCRKCKHTEKGKKSCVCVVPLSQRRTSLQGVGCQTCNCKGCSIEDYISRGQDPQYRPARIQRKQSDDPAKSLCCKKCAASKQHRRCVCQLPKNRRKNKLQPKGCRFCGCQGCNNKQESSSQSSSSRSRSRNKSEQSENSHRVINEMEMNFNNIDRSILGRVVIVQYNMNPALIGLGIPQRTPSYILGKPL